MLTLDQRGSAEALRPLEQLTLLSLDKIFDYLKQFIAAKPLAGSRLSLPGASTGADSLVLPEDEMWLAQLTTGELFTAMYGKLRAEVRQFDPETLERWEKKVFLLGSAPRNVLAISTAIHEQIMQIYALIHVEVGRRKEGGVLTCTTDAAEETADDLRTRRLHGIIDSLITREQPVLPEDLCLLMEDVNGDNFLERNASIAKYIETLGPEELFEFYVRMITAKPLGGLGLTDPKAASKNARQTVIFDQIALLIKPSFFEALVQKLEGHLKNLPLNTIRAWAEKIEKLTEDIPMIASEIHQEIMKIHLLVLLEIRERENSGQS